jgi:hypothetical protein
MKRILIGLSLVVTFAVGATAQNIYYHSKYADLNWHCSNWEDNWKVTPGGHSAIVMFAEKEAGLDGDRRVCYATLKSDEPNYQVLTREWAAQQ